MKRLGSSDSLGALMSMCPTADMVCAEEHSPRSNHNNMYSSREYQSMLDGLDEEVCMEETGHVSEKKRRLSVDQVKALERSFEVENKLEPERKVKLAQELGLQPRQVAVWFQNRRARWKTKQLERDYGVLKASFDSLKQNYDALQRDKDALLNEIKELKSKLNEEEESKESNLSSIKEEPNLESGSDTLKLFEPITPPPASLTEDANLNVNLKNAELKDGQSDSDSSAILNEDQSPNASNSSPGFVQNHQISIPFRFNSSNSSLINCSYMAHNNVYHPQFVKMEEHNFFGVEEEEACDFFSDEQAPTLHWGDLI